MPTRIWKKSDWRSSEEYKRLCEQERAYGRRCEPSIGGWTCIVLSVIFASPLLYFCYECFIK